MAGTQQTLEVKQAKAKVEDGDGRRRRRRRPRGGRRGVGQRRRGRPGIPSRTLRVRQGFDILYTVLLGLVYKG